MNSNQPDRQNRADTGDESSGMSASRSLTKTVTMGVKSTKASSESFASPEISAQSLRDVMRDADELFTELGVGAADVRAGRIGALLGSTPERVDFSWLKEYVDVTSEELLDLDTEKKSA